MGGWGRWLVVVLVWGGLELSDASRPVIVFAVLFVATAFMEIDVVRLKQQASTFQSRLDALEYEMDELREIKAHLAAPAHPPPAPTFAPMRASATPAVTALAADQIHSPASTFSFRSHWGLIIFMVMGLLLLVLPQVSRLWPR